MDTEEIYRLARFIDFEKLYTSTPGTAVLNDFDFSAPTHVETLARVVFSKTGDAGVASCECGHLEGNMFIGTRCPECGTVVASNMEAADGHLRFKAWLRCPEIISGGWINPEWADQLTAWMAYKKNQRKAIVTPSIKSKKKGSVKTHGNYLFDLLDTNVPFPKDVDKEYVSEQGFSYFYENFDRIMYYFLNVFKKTAEKDTTEGIRYLLDRHRDTIFTRYIPVRSSILHPITVSDGLSSNRQKYVDINTQYVLSAANALSYLDHSPRRRGNLMVAETAAFGAYMDMFAYRQDVASNHISVKSAIARQHVMGSRLHETFRGVISPITTPHDSDELHVPWKIMVNTLSVPIMGRLCARGKTFGEAYNQYYFALSRIDEEIKEIMLQLMDECPFEGIPCLLNRNPTLQIGSIMLLFIKKIKFDIHDETIGYPSILCKRPNADFDGDHMNGLVLLHGWREVKKFMSIHPSNLYISRNRISLTPETGIPQVLTVVANQFLDMCRAGEVVDYMPDRR